MYLFVYKRYSVDFNFFFIVVVASDVINVTLVIAGENCTVAEYNQLWEKLRKMVTKWFM